MQWIDAAFDTCASIYLIHYDVLRSGIDILPCEKKLSLFDANGAEISFEGPATILLKVVLSLLADFLVASKLSVTVFLCGHLLMKMWKLSNHVNVVHFLRILRRCRRLDISRNVSCKLVRDYLVPSDSEFVVAIKSREWAYRKSFLTLYEICSLQMVGMMFLHQENIC